MAELTDWDRRLIERHLSFYEALANGERVPETVAQQHFVDVCAGHEGARTQHEIAYQRYLKLHGRTKAAPPTPIGQGSRKQFDMHVPGAPNFTIDAAEEAIDAIEEAELTKQIGRAADRFFCSVKSAYRSRASAVAQRGSEAALWLTALTADREWSAMVGQLSGEAFNTLSTVYTKAMDGAFADGLMAGGEYVSPWLHRLIDGGSTIIGSWERVQNALPDDGLVQEIVGWSRAYLSDFSSTVGMPVITLNEETYRTLDAVMQSAGLPPGWTLDALTINLEEMASALVPGLAVLLNWSSEERQAFQRMLGSLAMATVVSASPVALVVLVVGLAREFHLARRRGECAKAYWPAPKEGS